MGGATHVARRRGREHEDSMSGGENLPLSRLVAVHATSKKAT